MDFDYDTLLTYYNTRNYQGAIDYINGFNYEGKDAITMRNELSKLNRAKSIEENTKKQLIGEDSEAYNFYTGLNSNYVDRTRNGKYSDGTEFKTTNHYGDEYLREIKNIKTNDGNTIDGIVIDVDDEEALIKLQKKLEEDNVSFSDIGIKNTPISDGKYRLTINTDNTNLYKVINKVNDLTTLNSLTAMGTGAVVGGGVGAIITAFTGGAGSAIIPLTTTAGSGLGGAIARWANDYEIKGISNGKLYDASDFNINSLNNAVNIVNKAKDKYDDITERKFNYDNTPSEISVSGYMSIGHANAANKAAKGIISKDDYNTCVKAWEDWMKNTIANVSFADKKVYAWGNKDGDSVNGKIERGKILDRVKNTDAEDVKTEILMAFNENRCSYSMATKDGVIGTMFTITSDEKNNEASNEFGNRTMNVFVENLYTGRAEEIFNQDSKTVAARQNADMKKLGYSRTLDDGTIIGYSNGIPYKEEYNSVSNSMVSRGISEAEMLSTLNESVNIDNSIDYILKNYNKDTGFVESFDGANYQHYTIYDIVNFLTEQALNESYPTNTYTSRERAEKEIYIKKSIYNGISKYIR